MWGNPWGFDSPLEHSSGPSPPERGGWAGKPVPVQNQFAVLALSVFLPPTKTGARKKSTFTWPPAASVWANLRGTYAVRGWTSTCTHPPLRRKVVAWISPFCGCWPIMSNAYAPGARADASATRTAQKTRECAEPPPSELKQSSSSARAEPAWKQIP